MVAAKPRKLKTPNGRSVKARGRNWENAIVTVFKRMGYPDAKRNGAVYGGDDRGDIGNVPLTVECKATDRVQLWKHLDEAIVEGIHNGTGDETVLINKRWEAPTADAAWTFPGTFAERLVANYYDSHLTQNGDKNA